MAATDPRHGPGQGPDQPPDVERRDVDVRRVTLALLGLVIVCSLTLIPCVLLLNALLHRETKSQQAPVSETAPPESQIPPEPRLQTSIGGDLARLREREDALLNSYGWVDATAGVVRLPIERAMDLVAREGLPVRPGAGPAPAPWPEARGTDAAGGADTRAVGRAAPAPGAPEVLP